MQLREYLRYSSFNTTSGSTVAARRAGTSDATTALPPSSTTIVAEHDRVVRRHLVEQRRQQPRGEQRSGESRRPSRRRSASSERPTTSRITCAAPRAERHPDADLARPLRDDVADHAVDADRREQQRDGGEHAPAAASESAASRSIPRATSSMVRTRVTGCSAIDARAAPSRTAPATASGSVAVLTVIVISGQAAWL